MIQDVTSGTVAASNCYSSSAFISNVMAFPLPAATQMALKRSLLANKLNGLETHPDAEESGISKIGNANLSIEKRTKTLGARGTKA